jgi:hypothetical protein
MAKIPDTGAVGAAASMSERAVSVVGGAVTGFGRMPRCLSGTVASVGAGKMGSCGPGADVAWMYRDGVDCLTACGEGGETVVDSISADDGKVLGGCAAPWVTTVVGAETDSLSRVAGAAEAAGDSVDGAAAGIEAGGAGADRAVARVAEAPDGCAAPPDAAVGDPATGTCGLAGAACGALRGQAH